MLPDALYTINHKTLKDVINNELQEDPLDYL